MNAPVNTKTNESHLSFVRHQNYVQALSYLHTLCSMSCQGRIIMVTGPAGAGKSSLLAELHSTLGGALRDETPRSNNGILRLFAKNSQLGYFNSKDFYTRLLDQLGDPFVLTGDDGGRRARTNRSEPRIQQLVEKLIVAHGITHLLVDEANLMCLNHSNRAPTDHLERLKVLAEDTGIAIVLAGTYPRRPPKFPQSWPPENPPVR
jgi:GTPase SAR1 family protein